MGKNWLRTLFSMKGTSTSGPALTVEPTAAFETAPSPVRSYSSDAPIESAAQDRFSRALFARRIAETIGSRQDPAGLVLGLYGPWGDGKTSVLHIIEETLKEQQNVVVTHFNPWQFTAEDDLIRGFFETLAAAVGARLTSKREEFGHAMKKYASLFSLVNGEDAASGLGNLLSSRTLEQRKAQVERFLAEGQLRVVVLIDDIDRLDRAETHQIFKLVKLTAGFSRTTYLLAFDDAVVAAALGERYGAGGSVAGRAYLEKIIQVPLHLPPIEPLLLRKLVVEGVDLALERSSIKLTESQTQELTTTFVGLEESLTTPRHAHLYVNALQFALPLVKDEVNIVEFMLVEGLRLFHPELHTALRHDSSILLGNEGHDLARRQERVTDLVNRSCPEMSQDRRERLTRRVLGHLFPRTINDYGKESEQQWAREQRVCSSFYFDKFFAYGMSSRNVSDRRVQHFLDSLPKMALPEQDAALTEFATSDSLPALVQRLGQLAGFLSHSVLMELAPLLARNGALLPTGERSFGGSSHSGAMLIYSLIRGADSAAKFSLAREVLKAAAPLPFGSECFILFTADPTHPSHGWGFDDGDSEQLRALFVERIMQADLQTPLYRQFGSDAPTLYKCWHVLNPEGLRQQLAESLHRGDQEVQLFLATFISGVINLSTGRPHLTQEAYESIKRLASPDVIAKLLHALYGEDFGAPWQAPASEEPLPMHIARRFLAIRAKTEILGVADYASSRTFNTNQMGISLATLEVLTIQALDNRSTKDMKNSLQDGHPVTLEDLANIMPSLARVQFLEQKSDVPEMVAVAARVDGFLLTLSCNMDRAEYSRSGAQRLLILVSSLQNSLR